MTVATHLRRTVASCLLAGLLGACLDLSLPNVPPDGGVGPELVIHTPREGDTIALNAPVSLEAASINGVSSMTVTCGGAPSTGVFSWSVAPCTGVVDFTRCSLVTSGAGDGGFGQLELTFIAVDRVGNVSTRRLGVFLDTTTAALSARNAPDLTAGNTFLANALCAQSFNGLSTGGCGTGLGCTAP